MIFSPVVLTIIAILVGLGGITSNAIGVNDIDPEQHPAARTYLIINLVLNICIVLGACLLLWSLSSAGPVSQLLTRF